MAVDSLDSTPQGDAGNGRLDSWKEIAAYLKRDVTTVRRWEKREGLPVHRHLHERRDSVYAFTQEVDRWWEGRRNHFAGTTGVDNGTSDSSDHDPPALFVTPTAPQREPRARLAWTLVALFFLTSLTLAALLVLRPAVHADSVMLRFRISPPEELSFGSAAVSPDGRHVAFTAVPRHTNRGKALLWVRSLETDDARSLRDSDNAAFPFWSAAGDALGFFAGGKLWIVDLAGGTPRALADAPDGRGATWSRDGTIVFAPGRDGPLFRVAATGGPATPITIVNRPHERGHLWPEFLPDGQNLLYLADSSVQEHHTLFVASLGGGTPKPILARAASNAVYGANGYLFFARDRQLLAQRFDANAHVLVGTPITITDFVQQQQGFDHKTDVSVATNGLVLYRSMQSPATRMVWRDREEWLSPLIDTPAEYSEPAFSPDDSRIAIGLFDPSLSKRFGYGPGIVGDIWIVDRATGARSQFTSHPAADWGPVWSPNGRTIVFSSNRRGKLELFERDVAGAEGDERPIATEGQNPVAQSWSPDGKFVVYSAFDPVTLGDLWRLPTSGDRTPVPLVRTKFAEEQGQIAPDGRWFAYTSHESGRPEVYVQRFPISSEAPRRVSTHGGADPRWRRDGKELFYIGVDRQLVAVPVQTGSSFNHGAAAPLFDVGVPPFWYEARNLYDVTRDRRFLFMAPVEDDRSMPYTVLVNWTARRAK